MTSRFCLQAGGGDERNAAITPTNVAHYDTIYGNMATKWDKMKEYMTWYAEVDSAPRPSHVEVRKRLRRLIQRYPQAVYTAHDFWTHMALRADDTLQFLSNLGVRQVRSGGRGRGYRRADIEAALGLGVQVKISPKHDGTAKGT